MSRYEFLSSRPAIIRNSTPAMAPVSREVLETISGAPPAAPVGHNMVANPPYLIELPDGRYIAPPPGLPMPKSMVASQVGRPGRLDIFVPGPPPHVIRPSTLHELKLIDEEARSWIRRNTHSPVCDEEFEAITDSWLRYLDGLYEYQESYPVMGKPHHRAIPHWRDIIKPLHEIVRRNASEGITALDMREIFPEHMLGADGLSPLDQARLAIINLSEARFGDFLAGLADWVHLHELSSPSFWINDQMIRWLTGPVGGLRCLFGNCDMRFLGAIDYLNECGGEGQFLVSNIRISSDGEPRQQGALELARKQSDHIDEPFEWYDEFEDKEGVSCPDDDDDLDPASVNVGEDLGDEIQSVHDEEDGGYLADEEDFDGALNLEDYPHKVEEPDELDGLKHPEDFRRCIYDLLKDIGRDLDTMIDAVPMPSDAEPESKKREDPEESDEPLGSEGPDELDELEHPEDLRRSLYELLEDMSRDLDTMIDAVPEPEHIDLEFAHNWYRQSPQSVVDVPEPEETPELRDVDLALAHSWHSQQSVVDDIDDDDDNVKEPEWVHDQDVERKDVHGHGTAYLDFVAHFTEEDWTADDDFFKESEWLHDQDAERWIMHNYDATYLDRVDQDTEEDWTDDDKFYPNYNQSSAFGQAITNNNYHSGGDGNFHDDGEVLGEGEQDWSDNDNDDDNNGELSDTGTVIHTPLKSESKESEDDDSSDDDDDSSDGPGSEGEGEQAEGQPDGPWLPIREPLNPDHSLYGFRSRWEDFEPPASPISRNESLLPPIQRPVVSVPAPASVSASERPTPALPRLSQQELALIHHRRFNRMLSNLNSRSSSSSQAPRLHLPPLPPPQQQQQVQPLVHRGQPLFAIGDQFQIANVLEANSEERLNWLRRWHGDANDLRYRPLYRAMVAGMARRNLRETQEEEDEEEDST
ncbi:hypothetical protein PG990_001114 [Apiospora arundinis]